MLAQRKVGIGLDKYEEKERKNIFNIYQQEVVLFN